MHERRETHASENSIVVQLAGELQTLASPSERREKGAADVSDKVSRDAGQPSPTDPPPCGVKGWLMCRSTLAKAQDAHCTGRGIDRCEEKRTHWGHGVDD